MNRDLDLVKNYQKEIALISKASALLSWDQEVYMPKEGLHSRSEVLSYLSEKIHNKIISNELWQAILRLEKNKLNFDDKLMLLKFKKDVIKSRKLPPSLVKEFSKQSSLAFSKWQEARHKNNYEIFRPYLAKLIDLLKEKAKLIDPKNSVYNVLLDDFEEGMSVEILRKQFAILKRGLIDLLRKIENSKTYKNHKRFLVKVNFPKDNQMRLIEDIINRIGLTKDSSRIDFSEHPFTIKISNGDVRFTTALRENPIFAFESSIHEAGHALYESNLPVKHQYDVLGDAPSLGLHESQSRFWENMISKNKNFWKFYYSKFNKELNLKKNLDDWYREINFVYPGLIRVEADEVHYCLHVILRFEIELDLFEGKLNTKDLPKVWNLKSKEIFGKEPKNFSEGVLQDVHWSHGYFCYFPTYAIGSIYAAQLFEAINKKFRNLDGDIAKGDFRKISQWLKENIHVHGKKMFSDEIIKKATGRGLDVSIYLNYLNKKYGEIYDF